MMIVGQSLELHRGRLARALQARDPAPLLRRARAQAAAGAHALDLNAGVGGTAEELAWTAAALRAGGVGLPLWLDSGSVVALVGALRRLRAEGVSGPFVANALPVGGPRAGPEAGALSDAAAGTDAGLVLSPRLAEGADAIAATARGAVEAARGAGVAGPVYVDALAWPPAYDAPACRRSLEALRRLRDAVPDAVPLAAVGNVSHGLGRDAARAMRVLYAAEARAAGAGALILPVEDRACLEAALGTPPSRSDALAEARRMLFGDAP